MHSEGGPLLIDGGGHKVDPLAGLHGQIDDAFDQDIEAIGFISLVEDCLSLGERFDRGMRHISIMKCKRQKES